MIIDYYDPYRRQICYPIKTTQMRSMLVKLYPFESLKDPSLKRALYEVSLYTQLPKSPFLEHYIMMRGQINTFVMVFNHFDCSLLDLVSYRKQAGYCWNK